VEFVVEGTGDCVFLDGEEFPVATLDEASRAAGVVHFERGDWGSLSLECLDAIGVTRASALLP
jgi:hypothetical protein